MDADTVKALFELLGHSGSAATIAAVWYISRASKTATDAVETLKRIEDSNIEVARLLARDRAEIAGKLDRIHEDIQSIPLATIRRRAIVE